MRDMLDNLFSITLVVFILLGTVLVALQLVAVVTLNGPLSILADTNLSTPAFVLASATGVIAFILSYLHGWKSGD